MARFQAEAFPTLATDQEPATLFPVSIIAAIRNAGIGTHAIIAGTVKVINIRATLVGTIKADVMGLDTDVSMRYVNTAEKVIFQTNASAPGTGVSTAMANDM